MARGYFGEAEPRDLKRRILKRHVISKLILKRFAKVAEFSVQYNASARRIISGVGTMSHIVCQFECIALASSV